MSFSISSSAVHLHAVQRDGNALLEAYLHHLRGPAGIGRLGPAVDLLGRLEVGVLQLSALNGPGPDVLVDRPGLLLGDGHFDAVLARVVDLPLAGQVQLSHGRDDPAVRGPEDGLEAELVVAATRAAVGQVLYALLLGDLCRFAGDERPGDGRSQHVSLIRAVGFDERERRSLHELLSCVYDVMLICQLLGPAVSALDIRSAAGRRPRER